MTEFTDEQRFRFAMDLLYLCVPTPEREREILQLTAIMTNAFYPVAMNGQRFMDLPDGYLNLLLKQGNSGAKVEQERRDRVVALRKVYEA